MLYEVITQTRQRLHDGTADGDQLKKRDRLHLTEEQLAQRTENKEQSEQFRTEFRATLSEEQLAILENAEMTREQKREALRATLTEAQQEMLQEQRELRQENRNEFRESLTTEQRRQLRQRLNQDGSCDGQSIREQIRVITSYSIHYTKLYDAITSPTPWRLRIRRKAILTMTMLKAWITTIC